MSALLDSASQTHDAYGDERIARAGRRQPSRAHRTPLIPSEAATVRVGDSDQGDFLRNRTTMLGEDADWTSGLALALLQSYTWRLSRHRMVRSARGQRPFGPSAQQGRPHLVLDSR